MEENNYTCQIEIVLEAMRVDVETVVKKVAKFVEEEVKEVTDYRFTKM